LHFRRTGISGSTLVTLQDFLLLFALQGQQRTPDSVLLTL
jgi:hypothetical protein